jgi:nicotinic acid mononucleotide adenylyltransferase
MQNYVLLDFDIPQISSTMVRNMIKTQQRVGSILTPGVHKIIKENNLYSN